MYVVSEDICILLQDWAEERNFKIPSHDFFLTIRSVMKNKLEEIFGLGRVDFVRASFLMCKLNQLAENINFPVVSLDKTYFKSALTIETSRAVDICLNDIGSVARHGCESVEQQIHKLKRQGFKEIVLLDDVIFSGGVMMETIELCRSQGINVSKIVSAICIGKGYKTLIQGGVEVISVVSYDEVIDEVCERDFYPGVPMSGRTVKDKTVNMGAPYLYPFGKPVEWASIPKEVAGNFSQFCIKQSVRLWKEIERVSGKMVRCSDLDRIPISVPYDDSRFVDYLVSLINN